MAKLFYDSNEKPCNFRTHSSLALGNVFINVPCSDKSLEIMLIIVLT